MVSVCGEQYYSRFSQAENMEIRNQMFETKWNYYSQPFYFVDKNSPAIYIM